MTGTIASIWARLRCLYRNVANKDGVEDDLDQEVRSSVEMLTASNAAAGMNPDEARRAALLEIGGLEQLKQGVREVKAGYMLDTIWQDVRYGARMIAGTPLFTVTALLTLALGIGATTAIFSVVNAVLLAPLPYPDGGHIVMVWHTSDKRPGDLVGVSPADFQDWKARNHVFEDIAASTDDLFTLTGVGDPDAVIAYNLGGNAFRLLGVKPILGQTFSEEQDQPGRNLVAVLSYALWKSRFGGDPGVIGRSIQLSGKPYTVIGVMPPGFDYPMQTELWTPLALEQATWFNRNARFIRVVARLKSGVTVQAAGREIAGIARDRPHTCYRSRPPGQELRPSAVCPLEGGYMDD